MYSVFSELSVFNFILSILLKTASKLELLLVAAAQSLCGQGWPGPDPFLGCQTCIEIGAVSIHEG